MRTQKEWSNSLLSAARSTRGGLVRDLARTVAYPPPQPRGVEIRQTHASWVFLTEHDVWKVKRPVDYGFLDYSDAERRRQCCEEEVRLGRRLAPDVYRGVAPIYGRADGHSFVGPGSIVEHAVHMRRLPDQHAAGNLLARDSLTPLHLQRLAERLAAFYESSPETPDLGAPEILEGNIAQSHEQCLPFVGRFVERDRLERLVQWQLATHRALRETQVGRAASGRIRDGHGDLRLEHVYFSNGAAEAPLVIDPIEFNRSFRCGDVALDVAFLAMELQASHEDRLAAWFLSCFARATNDYDFYPLLDLYLSYRAFVRAKVACFVAGDRGTAPAKASRKAREAAQLFALAESYGDRPRENAPLIAVGGMIGAGKSTLAEALSWELQAPAISSDATRKHLGGLSATAPGAPALYTQEFTSRTYAEVFRRAQVVLESGRGAVLDGSFREASQRAEAMAVAAKAGRPFLFVELVADDQTLRERLRQRSRTATISDAREDLLERFRDAYQPATELAPSTRLVLDARLPTNELAQEVRRAYPQS